MLNIISGTFRSCINNSDIFLYIVLFLCCMSIILMILKMSGKSFVENLNMLENSQEFIDIKKKYDKFKSF